MIPVVVTGPDARSWRAAADRAVDIAPSTDGLPTLARDLADAAHPDHPYRAVLPIRDAADLAALTTLDAEPVDEPGLLVAMFSGQSSQRARMGRDLASAYWVVDATMQEVVDQSAGLVATPLGAVLDDPSGDLVDDPVLTQPALLAFGLSVSRLLSEVGVRPDLVCGHSFGEIAAAASAGVWSTAAATRIACARGRLLGGLPAGGGMVAVEASEDEVTQAITGTAVEVSAVHSATAVVIAGPDGETDRVAVTFTDQGRSVTRLPVGGAYHTAAVDGVLDDLREVFARGAAQPATAHLVANASGVVVDDDAPTDPDHWVRHCRRTVRWADCVAAAQDAGGRTFVEIGPRGVLTRMSRPLLRHPAVAVSVVDPEDEVDGVVRSLVEIDRRGHPVDWAALMRARRGPWTTAPTVSAGR